MPLTSHLSKLSRVNIKQGKTMSWETEKEDYINKLRRLKVGAANILDLPANRIVNPETARRLEDIRDNAEFLLEKLEKGIFEIAVVGLEKAGKSSFSNAIAGLNTLPTADRRCTYTSTCIRPGTSNAAIVTFLTRAELDQDLREKLAKLRIANAGNYNLDNLPLEKYEQLYRDSPEEVKKAFGDTVNEEIRAILANKDSIGRYLDRGPKHFRDEEVDSQEVRDFITEPAKALAVKDIVIYSTELKGMPNAVLYDVPGFDSPTELHRKQTFEKMDRADAIIAVANAKSPSLTKVSLDTFRQHDQDGWALSSKLFIFANKADQIDNEKALEENRATTREEWCDNYRILDPSHTDRIIFGSAAAALGHEKARAQLEELHLDDGIQKMRDRLEDYSRNERFEILKIRIGKLLAGVRKLFEEAEKEYAPQGASTYVSDISEITLALAARVKPALRKSLEQLRHDMNSNLEKERPLSKDIRAKIADLVTVEKYGLGEEEMANIHREISGQNSFAERPPALDSRLRERRFDPIYWDFCRVAQDCAVSGHRDISESILRLFMEALGVTSVPEYDELASQVRQLCHFEAQDESSYYHSLIERFGRDLFEILIKNSHGQERLNKFRAEMANFFSMGVFYDSGEDLTTSVNPIDSLFWRILLYPEIASMPDLEALVEMVKKGTGLPSVSEPVRKLLRTLIARKGAAAVETLEDILASLPVGKNEAIVASAFRELLERAAGGTGSDVKELVLEDGYLRDVQRRRGNYTYQDVAREFADDLSALRAVLLRAFVPAVNLEKAFGARETRRLEEIHASLDGPEFNKFLSRNITLIEAARLGELRRAESQRRADEAVMKEISAILAQIEKAA